MIGKTKAPKGTKLGAALRALSATVSDEIVAAKISTTADALDRAAIAVGARGARVKQLGAYHTALRLYQSVGGVPYVE